MGDVGMCGPAETRDHVDVCSPCYHRRPFECLWSVLLPEAKLMPMGLTTVRDSMGVH